MINCIIFDMDGVLVDSEPVIEKAAIMFFKEIGVNAVSDDFKPFIGAGEDRYIGGVCEKYGIQYNTDMKKRVYDIYLEIVGSFLKVYEGTLPTLIKLKEKGYKLALASSADAVKINANLTVAGIDKSIFDVIISGGDVKNKKPAPDIYLKTAKTLGEEPEKCVVIEDAINGVKAAKDAGMICIGLTTSFSKDRILDAGADYICSDIKDIYDIIKN
ncbi:MAG: HAD-IA family hydrolase [Eubacteriales bacterium]|nr:HAD-IA family hydrolase [Eubacteriales bacterium]